MAPVITSYSIHYTKLYDGSGLGSGFGAGFGSGRGVGGITLRAVDGGMGTRVTWTAAGGWLCQRTPSYNFV